MEKCGKLSSYTLLLILNIFYHLPWNMYYLNYKDQIHQSYIGKLCLKYLWKGTTLCRITSSKESIHFSARVVSLSITRGRTPSNQFLKLFKTLKTENFLFIFFMGLQLFKIMSLIRNPILTNTWSEKKWAASWQNQQNDCAPSKDSAWASAQSDQSFHCGLNG